MRQKQPETQPQHYWNTPILLTKHIYSVQLHMQTNIKVGVAITFRRENLAVNAQQTNKGLNLRSFFPALIIMISIKHVVYVFLDSYG